MQKFNLNIEVLKAMYRGRQDGEPSFYESAIERNLSDKYLEATQATNFISFLAKLDAVDMGQNIYEITV